jgi:hypothetical protein
VSDAWASVFWFPKKGEEPPHDEEGSEAEACFSGQHPVPVDEIFGFSDGPGPCTAGCLLPDWHETIALAGPVLAYSADSGEDTKYVRCDCEHRGIVVRNLQTGRLLHHVPTGPHDPMYKLYVGVGNAQRVVVKSDGSVAWSVQNIIAWDEAGQNEPISYEVRDIERHQEHLLAAGPDVDAQSLTLNGSRLSWVQGGKPMSATLE